MVTEVLKNAAKKKGIQRVTFITLISNTQMSQCVNKHNVSIARSLKDTFPRKDAPICTNDVKRNLKHLFSYFMPMYQGLG